MRKPTFLVLDFIFAVISKIIKRKKIIFKKEEIKKILVIKYCCIGDVLMTTPLLEEIKRNFKNAKIDYCVGNWSKDVIINNKNISRIYIKEKNTEKDIKNTIRHENYDIIFILDLSFSDILFAYSIKPKILVGIDAFNRGILLNYKTKHFIGDKIHEREIYLKTLESLGVKTSEKNMKLYLTDKEKEIAENFWKENSLGSKKVIGVFPGGGKNPGTSMSLKQWGEEKYAKLSDLLIEKGNKVILFGSKNDKETVQKTKTLMKQKCIDISGKFDLRETAAIIEKCDLFITNDSGPMHIAASVGTKTISIFGPTDPNLLKPYGEKHHAFFTKETCVADYSSTSYKNKNCHPCYRQIIGDFNNNCKTKECMEKIKVEQVEKQAILMLKNKKV